MQYLVCVQVLDREVFCDGHLHQQAQALHRLVKPPEQITTYRQAAGVLILVQGLAHVDVVGLSRAGRAIDLELQREVVGSSVGVGDAVAVVWPLV